MMLRSKSKKRGSLIVAVLVVLFLVVLMSTQTLQTLLLVRRSDSWHGSLRQARELVELGRIIRRQHPQTKEFEPVKLSLGNNLNGMISIELRSVAGPERSLNVAAESANPVADEDSLSSAPQPEVQPFRVIATFPAGTDGEVTATWEGQN